jgi:glutamate synthase domain-containing protein 3
MSGGIAYIYDEAGDFKSKCNMDMVALEKLSDEDLRALKRLISEHYECTQSPVAKNILDDFKNQAYRFVRVMPLEYRRILEGKKQKPPELAEVSDG